MNEIQNDKPFSSWLKEGIMAWGANLVGFTDIEPLIAQHLDLSYLLEPCDFGLIGEKDFKNRYTFIGECTTFMAHGKALASGKGVVITKNRDLGSQTLSEIGLHEAAIHPKGKLYKAAYIDIPDVEKTNNMIQKMNSLFLTSVILLGAGAASSAQNTPVTITRYRSPS